MKKLSIMLACLLLMQVCVFAAGEDEKAALSPRLEEAVFVLDTLGVVQKDAETGYRLDSTLTRAEFCALVTRMLGVSGVGTGSASRFSDVADGHWAAADISTAAEMGIINGHPDGTFRPDEAIVCVDVQTILLKLLGYQTLAESRGGYPGGYEILAVSTGLKDGVASAGSQAVPRSDAFMLVYNAMNADRVNAYSNGGMEVKTDNTLFKERLEQLGWYYMEGVVNTVEGVSLQGLEKVEGDRIQIDDAMYDLDSAVQNGGVEQWLGRRVRYFVDDEDVVHGILVRPGYNETLTIEADNIRSASRSGISYYVDEEQSATEELELADECAVVYNDRVTWETDDSLFEIGNGTLTALDNDRDGSYDVVFLNTYDSFVVERINSTDRILFIKDTMVNGRPYILLDSSDKGFISVLRDAEGNEIAFEDIAVGDSVTVRQSKDAMRVTVDVVNQSVSGTITELDADKGELMIDGTLYNIAKNSSGAFAIDPSDIAVGTTMHFYADLYGDLFAINDTEVQEERYAYIVGHAISKGISGTVQLKLLHGGYMQEAEDELADPDSDDRFYKEVANQSIEVVTCAERVRIDGSREDTADVNWDALDNAVITYKTNSEGLLTELTTALPNGVVGERSYDADTDTFGGNIGGAFFADERTLIFNIPTDTSNEDNFFAKVELRDGDSLDIRGYNCSVETKFADVAVINADIYYDVYPTITVEKTPITVIERVSQKVNSDGDAVYNIRGYRNGKAIEKICRDSAYMENRVKNLSMGDVVRISEDGAGRVADLQVVRRLNPLPEYMHENPRGGSEEMYGDILGIELDTLEDFSTSRCDIIRLQTAQGESAQFVIPDTYNKAACYFYDTVRQTLEPVSLDEVNSVENTDASMANQAYVFANYSKVQVVVVVK